MDTLTHMALGAVVGEVVGGKILGRRAAVAGMLIALLPDLDVAVQPFLDSATSMLFHRGITHSFLVWLIISPLIGYLIWRHFRSTSRNAWYLVAISAWFSHIFIDGFNSYGTAWFLPFSSYRVAIGSIAVVDIFITLPLLFFLVALVLNREKSIFRHSRWLLGYIAFYIVLSLALQHSVEARAEVAFNDKGIVVDRIKAYPTPFIPLVWQVGGETDSSFVVANQGVFKNSSWDFYPFRKNWNLLLPLVSNREVARAIRFTQGQYIVRQSSDTLFISDLRLAPLVLDGDSSQFVVSFPISVRAGVITVGKAYPKRNFSKKTFSKWVGFAF
ncbi:metal-dependent hydrolase [Williamwhitmania taraxaci]|uniref:Inner membrane protein n=1 Tax=Williamwhitmania taraxaci TaxID=1640674 RepID=A0A1G6Q6D2_9BACT|nr:metal-dependent hydrolase [Williamwhitmania taraxaci]SDC87903.1 inner membrane protein [Williamwhitmania taraxaci]